MNPSPQETTARRLQRIGILWLLSALFAIITVYAGYRLYLAQNIKSQNWADSISRTSRDHGGADQMVCPRAAGRKRGPHPDQRLRPFGQGEHELARFTDYWKRETPAV